MDVYIKERLIGKGLTPYLVAEIGINHNGSVDLAKEMIRQAAASGADAVKFQNYRTEDFIRDKSIIFTGMSQGKVKEYNQFELFKKCELKEKDFADLFEFCNKLNIDFHSTPTNSRGVDFLCELGSVVLKNGSDFLTNYDLIRYMGKSGLTTVLSTGMALESEIGQAVKSFKETGNNKLILLHCTSAYPTVDQEVNLRKMRSLSEKFNTLTGFSDHTADDFSAVIASAMGACWIEKHFTIDPMLPGPDQYFSITPEKLKILKEKISRVENVLGSSIIKPSKTELENRNNFQLSIVAKEDLKKGLVLEEKHLTFSRPGGGIEPDKIDTLLGRKVMCTLKAGERFSLELLI